MKTLNPLSLVCLAFYLFFLTVIGTRLITVPQANLDLRGFPVWLEIFSLLILYGHINLSALGLGQKIVQLLPKSVLTVIEFNLLSYLFGLGILAIGIFFLGMFSLMNSFAIFIYLVVSGLLTLSEWPYILQALLNSIKSFRKPIPDSLYEILYWVFGGGTLILLIMITLTPVWDYDALMYHLEIPRQYLQHGRIYLDANIYRSFYPLLTEMLFIPGIAFHLDALAKMISLTYGIIFLWSTYALGLRLFNREIALLSAGIIAGIPSFPTWASWASIDFAWASYELWGVYALVIWLNNNSEQDNKWLILAGLMSGLAASTKYLALPDILLNSIFILWNTPLKSRHSFAKIIKDLAIFGISASIVMSPWYVKNLWWIGNPFYPLLVSGPRFQFLSYYVHSFGVGNHWFDFLLLPLNVYRYHDNFSTISWEIIHPALWFALGLVLLRNFRKYAYLAIYSLLYFALWVFNTQVIRFLTPVSAIVALLAAYVISRLPKTIKKWLSSILLGGFICLSFFYQLWEFNDAKIIKYFSGQASAADLLQAQVGNYRATKYIQSNLSETDRVQFLWDGRTYYCDQRCVSDDTQARGMNLSNSAPAPESVAHQLRTQGITHIMINRSDAQWFIDFHDPDGLQKSALHYFEQIFLPACAKSIYTDNITELYVLICQ
jgi:hypothetical protein